MWLTKKFKVAVLAIMIFVEKQNYYALVYLVVVKTEQSEHFFVNSRTQQRVPCTHPYNVLNCLNLYFKLCVAKNKNFEQSL